VLALLAGLAPDAPAQKHFPDDGGPQQPSDMEQTRYMKVPRGDL
jgi:hypothetical protein